MNYGNKRAQRLMEIPMYVNDALRLMAGFFVLLSLALGYTVHPGFYLFTAFVGINLLQSGLTRWCPAMWLLKKAGMKDCPHQNAPKAP